MLGRTLVLGPASETLPDSRGSVAVPRTVGIGRKAGVQGSQCEPPGRVEAVEKRKNASYDVSEAPDFLAGTVEAPVDTGSAA
jgi:hypothetical protein